MKKPPRAQETPPQGDFHYLRFAMIPSCIVDDTRVTLPMLRVYLCAASYASERNGRYVWGKPNEIADRLGMSRQRVSQLIAALEGLGYLHVNRSVYRKDGGRDANRIRLLMDVEVPALYVREIAEPERKRAGVGGRPRKIINIVDKLDETPPPRNSLEFTPLKLQGVAPPETPGVAPPETQSFLADVASPHELRGDAASETRQEDLLRGSSKRISKRFALARESVSPSPQKITRAEADRRRIAEEEEKDRRWRERVKGAAR